MAWVLVFIMFNHGLHYAQTSPYMYEKYDDCREAATELKKTLLNTRPNDSANVVTFCVNLPKEI